MTNTGTTVHVYFVYMSVCDVHSFEVAVVANLACMFPSMQLL
jgi:hypothetical protein